jgi:hypothetical protein
MRRLVAFAGDVARLADKRRDLARVVPDPLADRKPD